MSYVDTNNAKKNYGVSKRTLQRWDETGKIKTIRTKGNHRRYFVPNNEPDNKFIYARVSSAKQEGDLQRQVEFLQKKYPAYTVIKDIGSGINFKRKGFKTILDKLFENNIKEVVIASPDRFCRFGFDFFCNLFQRFGAKITVVNGSKSASAEQELAHDLLSIVTVFAARYHGARKYSALSKGKNISK